VRAQGGYGGKVEEKVGVLLEDTEPNDIIKKADMACVLSKKVTPSFTIEETVCTVDFSGASNKHGSVDACKSEFKQDADNSLPRPI
jgi:hypothetical protein